MHTVLPPWSRLACLPIASSLQIHQWEFQDPNFFGSIPVYHCYGISTYSMGSTPRYFVQIVGGPSRLAAFVTVLLICYAHNINTFAGSLYWVCLWWLLNADSELLLPLGASSHTYEGANEAVVFKRWVVIAKGLVNCDLIGWSMSQRCSAIVRSDHQIS